MLGSKTCPAQKKLTDIWNYNMHTNNRNTEQRSFSKHLHTAHLLCARPTLGLGDTA